MRKIHRSPGIPPLALVAAGVLALILTVSSCNSSTMCPKSDEPVEVEAGAVPASVRRVFVVVLENTDADDALAQAYHRELADRGGYLSNFHALTHPSQPNYIGMVAGSQLGVDNNDLQRVDARHLGDLLEEKEKSWKVYAENHPGGCFLGKDSGSYVRRHVPFLSFVNIQDDPARCAAHVVPSTELAKDVAARTLPDFALYIPNNDNNGHDTGVAHADRWARDTLGPLLADPSFVEGTLVVLLYDEADDEESNRIYATFYGDAVRPGSTDSTCYDHYNLLRTVEEVLSLGTLGRLDSRSLPIQGIWAPR